MHVHLSVAMDMYESCNKLVIALVTLLPHVGYWHGSDVKPNSMAHAMYNNM